MAGLPTVRRLQGLFTIYEALLFGVIVVSSNGLKGGGITFFRRALIAFSVLALSFLATWGLWIVTHPPMPEFEGEIENAKFYNRALTRKEIRQIYWTEEEMRRISRRSAPQDYSTAPGIDFSLPDSLP